MAALAVQIACPLLALGRRTDATTTAHNNTSPLVRLTTAQKEEEEDDRGEASAGPSLLSVSVSLKSRSPEWTARADGSSGVLVC